MTGSIRRHLRRLWTTGHQTGQAVVELALVMVVFTPIMLGSVDLGRAYFDYDVLAHAANEGARRASFDRDTAAIISATRTASGRLNIPADNVTVTCYVQATTTTKTCGNSVTLNDAIKVTATSVFTPITPFVANLVPGGTLTISASARRTYQ